MYSSITSFNDGSLAFTKDGLGDAVYSQFFRIALSIFGRRSLNGTKSSDGRCLTSSISGVLTLEIDGNACIAC